jgi:hypothetical protein
MGFDAAALAGGLDAWREMGGATAPVAAEAVDSVSRI